MSKTMNHKGRRKTDPFVALPKNMMNSTAFKRLSPVENKVFIHLCAEYNGKNNGNITLPYNRVNEFDLSRQTLSKALKSLTEKGFIKVSRQGERGKLSLYALTHLEINECLNKYGLSVHHLKPTTKASNEWREYDRELKERLQAKNATSKGGN
ncbi:hypothetical protein [Lonepinella sp. BR2271]|uniref:hypothetical protein n=1 Tax=Lonepinella sp. BR2271 TaxID=3434550 RepID=UPI003F6DD75A